MIVSPLNAGIPTLAPSVNPMTEQAARDNKIREKVRPASASLPSGGEPSLKGDDKQMRRPGWDPSEHPDYASLDGAQQKSYGYQQEFEQLVLALSADSYMKDVSELGYSMHIRLPRALLEELAQISKMERIRSVIRYKYAQATVPNPPTEMLKIV
ncbi:ATP-dependent Lon protease [Photobacterium sp. SP02]|uniref:ATP-dependent Lon protease n=1 Tax=unclassified Photobacterium TaxID=2628852 RepID=UPI00301CE5A5